MSQGQPMGTMERSYTHNKDTALVITNSGEGIAIVVSRAWGSVGLNGIRRSHLASNSACYCYSRGDRGSRSGGKASF
jgi:hypothetical protein